MITPKLLIKDVSLSLSRRKILDQLSFSLQEGEATALLGHNGAGKTTLFHLILGLKFQNEGIVEVSGIPAHQVHARKKLSFVPERPYLNPNDTPVEMLAFYGKLSGLSGTTLKNRILEVIKEVGLEEVGGKDVARRKLKAFSKGMLQRSLIAQALLSNPEILILDEPMSGLDPEGRAWVKELIQKLKSQNKTILFSTHVIEDAEELADQVIVMSQGKIKFKGSTKEYTKEFTVGQNE